MSVCLILMMQYHLIILGDRTALIKKTNSTKSYVSVVLPNSYKNLYLGYLEFVWYVITKQAKFVVLTNL